MTKQLADPERSGVYQLDCAPEEVELDAKEAGLAVFRLDVGDAGGKNDFLERIARALSFPTWFGNNWDALNDCLTDLDWLPTKTGYVLVFEKTENFHIRHQQVFDNAIAVLTAAAEYWKSQGKPFWAFIDGPLRLS